MQKGPMPSQPVDQKVVSRQMIALPQFHHHPNLTKSVAMGQLRLAAGQIAYMDVLENYPLYKNLERPPVVVQDMHLLRMG